MEKFWDTKRIRLLLSADPDTAEQFITQFMPAIYIWVFYQVGSDANIATDLTSFIFSQVPKNLPSFNPTSQTLFQWLKQQATQIRDEWMETKQMEPQRPWAWSQLTDEVLCTLSRLRSEPLNDEVLTSSIVHEIIQASLVELDDRDRELLSHRFCHLDNEEHIAEELNCRIEDVQDWLYRSRHSFRRTFFQLIASSNNGFSESNDTGDIKIQDTNLEKLLSTTTLYQVPDDAQSDIINGQFMQSLRDTAQPLPKETQWSKLSITGIILTIIVIILTGTIWITQKGKIDSPPPSASDKSEPQKPSTEEPVQTEKRRLTQDDINEEELKRVFALGQAGNVDALLEILKSGQFVSQRIAAPFLGKLADPNAIDLLQQAADHWYPESPNDNPFTDAIEKILLRFPEAVPPVLVDEAEPEPEKTDDVKEQDQRPAIIPNIAGVVRDFSNQPIQKAELQLTERRLFSKVDSGRKLASTQTNELGQYQFSNIHNQPLSLSCRISEGDAKVITQSLWCGNDSNCIVDFGGRPALTGTVLLDNAPLAGQTLYLSNALDINDASFREEVITDSDGNFFFLGVMPGIYSIMYRGLDNRIHRLESIEIPQQTTFDVNLNIVSTKVWVDDAAVTKQAEVSRAVLVYALDISDSLSQIQSGFSEEGMILFENVIPGDYVLRVQLNNGVWLQQNVQISSGLAEQTVQLDPIQEQTSVLYGNLLNVTPTDLFLTSMDQKVRIDITPDSNGAYELSDIPSDIYSLAAFIKGQLIRFMEIDLQTETEVPLDIDPAEMMRAYSPLYVMVADATGIILSDAQIWLTGTGAGNLLTASSTGQGAFLATQAGQYSLSVAHPQYPTVSREIILIDSTLLAEPNSDNTVIIQLGDQDK